MHLAKIAKKGSDRVMNELIELVNKLRRPHYICEDDCTISCPLAVNEDGESACCNDSWLSANAENAHKCTCGADEHNRIVDEVIKRLKVMEEGDK